MKGDVYRKVLIVHLFFDVIIIPAMCMFFYPARYPEPELKTPVQTPEFLCYPPELNDDQDWFTVNYENDFGPV